MKRDTQSADRHGMSGESKPKKTLRPEAVVVDIDSAAQRKGVVESTPPDRVPVPSPTPDGAFDLERSEFYLNRELTWLNFNFRVLHEAENRDNPLLERIKFAAIVGSNLDEFFMKRIGGLKQQVGAGVVDETVDGRTPEQQIAESYQLVRELEDKQHRAIQRILTDLTSHGVVLAEYGQLNDSDQEYLRHYYIKNIFPLVTPQATDPAHPFPFVSNLSLNLIANLRYPKEVRSSLGRVKVPVGAGIPRFLRLEHRNTFVPLEDVMAHNLDLLFPGMEVESCDLFRVTRNANTELEEETADDLLALIETELRERRFAPIVRLDVEAGIDPTRSGRLVAELGLNQGADVFSVSGLMAKRDLMELTAVKEPSLHYAPHYPVDHPAMKQEGNVFRAIRDSGSILLHHPYQSFATSVERFVREASEDPKVRAIKMTLYRTSDDSKVMRYLIDAARRGTQVAVVLELKAQFDEEANIRWANELEQRGVHVTYGVVGLKTHCKAILVVRQDHDGLRRYSHVGTGNYHAGTARLYSDTGLLTCDEEIGHDLTELFNYLTTGYKPKRDYIKIFTAPKTLKQALLDKIYREIAHHAAGRPGHIQFKMNALEDVDVTRALYEASQRGVQIDLNVRDTCRLRPGIPGLSENVRVVSLVGRFLEHSRIYHFANGGDPEYYIGSADIMNRNLASRVEILVPIEDPPLQRQLRLVLDLHFEDTRNGWDMLPDGSYVHRRPTSRSKERNVHETQIEWSEKQLREAMRLRRRKAQGIRKRNVGHSTNR